MEKELKEAKHYTNKVWYGHVIGEIRRSAINDYFKDDERVLFYVECHKTDPKRSMVFVLSINLHRIATMYFTEAGTFIRTLRAADFPKLHQVRERWMMLARERIPQEKKP